MDIFNNVDKRWTLFLDRDGVINVRLIDDYVKSISEFQFCDGTLEAIANFSKVFGRIIIVTNQRGIARGLMTEDDYDSVTNFMLSEIDKKGGHIDQVYHCPHDRDSGCNCRKPLPGMAQQARSDYPEIELTHSIMAGDSASDMAFAHNAGIIPVFIGSSDKNKYPDIPAYPNLLEFSRQFVK